MTSPPACLPRKGCLSARKPNPCARFAGIRKSLLLIRRSVWLFSGQTSGWYGRGGGFRHTLLSFRASGREGYRVPLSFLCAAVTRRDSLLILGMGFRTLPPPLVHLYISGFLRTAPDAVAFQHQMPVVSIDIAGKSAERDFAPPAYIDSGKVGRGI